MAGLADFEAELNVFSQILCIAGVQFFTFRQHFAGQENISWFLKIWSIACLVLFNLGDISFLINSIFNYNGSSMSLHHLPPNRILMVISGFFSRSAQIGLFLFSTIKQMKIFGNFKELSEISYFRLGHRINYKRIKVDCFKYLLKLCMIKIIIDISIQSFSSTFVGFNLKSLYLLLIILFDFFSVFKYVFVVNLLNLNLREVESLLENLMKSDPRSTNFNDKLVSIKHMYGIIYKISKKINENFGWILAAMFYNCMILILMFIFDAIVAIKAIHNGQKANFGRKNFFVDVKIHSFTFLLLDLIGLVIGIALVQIIPAVHVSQDAALTVRSGKPCKYYVSRTSTRKFVLRADF